MPGGPKPLPLGLSLTLHAAVLGWVALGPARAREETPKSLYQQVIAGHEKKIVWYTFREKLPEISPLERHGISQAPRAEVKAEQSIVAHPPQAPRSRQLIWEPAPRLEIQPELKAPNLLAMELPKVPAPPERPKPKLFAPPPPERPKPAEPAMLPAAPQLRTAMNGHALVGANPTLPAKPQPKPFVPPVEAKREVKPAAPLPAGPMLAANTNPTPKLVLEPGIALPAKPQPKPFVAPVEARRTPGPAPVLPAAPGLSHPGNPGSGAPLAADRGIALPARPAPRRFTLPAANGRPATAPETVVEAAPALSAAAGGGNVTLAIVGLNPAERLEAPLPEGSRNAQFSGGPEPHAKGGSGEPIETARIFVPDLMIRGAKPDARPVLSARTSPTSPENLMAAMRSGSPAAAPASIPPMATRVSTPPDPRLEGRPVYAISIQMPNVTSYIGSWIVWFAERDHRPGLSADLRPPIPLRKVDPKYIPSAVDDRIEGKVRLAAVIRKDGHVDSVSLLKKLDERLDRSAEEALKKWLFEPAQRNGMAIDVDAVVEIPFQLAPRARR